MPANSRIGDRKSTRLNSSHTVIYTLSLHDALPIYLFEQLFALGLHFFSDFFIQFLIRAQAVHASEFENRRSEERRVGKECRSLCDWSSDVCSSDLSFRATLCAWPPFLLGLFHPVPDPSPSGTCQRIRESEIGRASCRERV